MAQHKAFEGVRVIDATQGVAGPHATMLLALHGADVVKIEPLEGDWGRALGELRNDHCAHSIAFNRGKRSIALDLKNPDGMKIAKALAAKADVFVESFRPGVMARLGLGHETLRAANPRLVYMSVSGFGQKGPNAKRPTVDSLIQAFTGMMVMNKTPDGVPHRQGMIAVDVLTGLYGFQALAPAITRQFRFNEGCYIDCNLMQAAASFQGAKLMEYVFSNGNPPPLYVPAGMFKTRDGYIIISSMRVHHFKALFESLGRPDIPADPRMATHASRIQHAKEINAVLSECFPAKTTQEWLDQLQAAGVFCERVNNYQDYLDHAQTAAMGAIDWFEQEGVGRLPIANIPGLPPAHEDAVARHAPHVGEHSRDILGEIGYGAADIDRLIGAKAVRAMGSRPKAAE